MPANCGLFLRDRETAFRIGLRGGGCTIEPVSLPAFGEMQGDFRKMQGGGHCTLAKSHQISIAWVIVSLLKRAGKSRENHLCSAGWFERFECGVLSGVP